MNRSILITTALLLLLSATGCMTNLTGIAPSTTPITAKDTYTVMGKAKGSSWGLMILSIPLFENDPSRKAVRRAIENGGGNALIEVSQDTNMLFLYFVSVFWTDVDGTAVQVERGGATVGAIDLQAVVADSVAGRPVMSDARQHGY